MSKPGTFKSFWLPRLGIVSAVAAAVALLYLSGIGCPIRFLFGIPCPGCGVTRACEAALRGNFEEAFRWHPLFPIAIPGFIYIAVGEYPLFGSAKRETVFCLIFAMLFIVIYLIRAFFAENLGLYYIDGGNGCVIELIHHIFEECF